MICEKLSRKDSWFGRLSHSWKHFFSLFEEVIATNSKRSGPEIFLRKDVVKICIKFTGEHPCRSAISINLQYNFIEITLRHGCFPVNLLHIFRTVFLKNTSGCLLLLFLHLFLTLHSYVHSHLCKGRSKNNIWSSFRF